MCVSTDTDATPNLPFLKMDTLNIKFLSDGEAVHCYCPSDRGFIVAKINCVESEMELQVPAFWTPIVFENPPEHPKKGILVELEKKISYLKLQVEKLENKKKNIEYLLNRTLDEYLLNR